MNQFYFIKAVDRLRQCVVIRIPGTSNRRADSLVNLCLLDPGQQCGAHSQSWVQSIQSLPTVRDIPDDALAPTGLPVLLLPGKLILFLHCSILSKV